MKKINDTIINTECNTTETIKKVLKVVGLSASIIGGLVTAAIGGIDLTDEIKVKKGE